MRLMMKSKIEKVRVQRLVCPGCGEKYDSISGYPDIRCRKCKFLFPLLAGQRIPQEFLKKEDVDAVCCDRCGELVTCTSDNMAMFALFPEVLCPKEECVDKGEDGLCDNHLLAIQYRKSWYPPSHFLRSEGRVGLIRTSGQKERVALSILNSEAKLDDSSFMHVPKTVDSKMLWMDGNAVGYYTYTRTNSNYPLPTLHQIFVRKENRRRGYATLMLNEFLSDFPKGNVGIESPNRDFLQVLIKVGHFANVKGKFRALGRISLYSSAA